MEAIAKRFREENYSGHIAIDLICYHEGLDLNIPGVNVERINPPAFIRFFLKDIPPGISVKKIICDLLFAFKVLCLLFKKRKNQYQLIHAVEESVFIAVLVKAIFSIPYIYDMDSSLAMQLIEKWPWLKPLAPVFTWFERLAVRNSMAVAPVCDALGVIAESHGAKHMVLLRDISLLLNESAGPVGLREELNLSQKANLLLYVGNLESYQGIDLLIESFAFLKGDSASNWYLIIIGGSDKDLRYYRSKIDKIGKSSKIFLLGPRPLAKLGSYIRQADILVTPRVKGNNTPMKIYSYMHSGVAILATRLPTHTQVLDDSMAMLAEPTVKQFSDAMLTLMLDKELREEKAGKAFKHAEENYTFEVFSKQLNKLYDSLVI